MEGGRYLVLVQFKVNKANTKSGVGLITISILWKERPKVSNPKTKLLQ